MATREEDIIGRYFEAFNNHDLDGVIASFRQEPVVVDRNGRRHNGRRHEGIDAVRRLYRFQFSLATDGRCDLRSLVGHAGRGMAESLFHGTRDREGTVLTALGAEVFEFADERDQGDS
jgi:hypothetical protein